MTLRQKLLLVALCTLALPVAGWLYVRQMETLLREGQAQALVASARAMARSLVVVDAPLPPAGAAWYLQHTPVPITVDGYADDWASLSPWAQNFGKNARVMLAEDDHWLYFYVDVRATHRRRADAGDRLVLNADHLIVSIASGEVCGTCFSDAVCGSRFSGDRVLAASLPAAAGSPA